MEPSSKPEIKVLQIITLFSVGGATETVVSIAGGLIKKGYTVHILTGPNIVSEGSMYETAKEKNIPVFTFNSLRREINIFRDIKIIINLARFIRKGNYSAVHTHSSKAGVVGRIAAFFARTPVIVHTVHGLPFHRYQTRLKKNSFIFIEKFSNLFCDSIVAVSQTIIDTMLGYHIGKKNKYKLIRSAFDAEIFRPVGIRNKQELRKRYGIVGDEIVIGKIARLSELKGHKYILEAFSDVVKVCDNVKLLIVGNGELEFDLKLYAERLGINEKVCFAGLVAPKEIPKVIDIMDVVVHTSLLEGLARVLPQAIMMGKPVISFNLDGAHEVINDGVNGYLIQPQNVDELAQKIIHLCKNPSLISNLGTQGKNLIGDQFCENKMINQIDHLYKELLERR